MCVSHPGPIDWVRHLEETLEHFDEVGGHRCLSRVFAELPVEEALSHVVLPYLHGVGKRWEDGAIGVGQEHFASNVIRSRLASMMLDEAREDGPLAVLACVPNEQHEFGLMALGLVLGRLGWRTCYLGANTPISEVVRACGRLGAAAVVLSARRRTAFAAHAPVLRHLAATTRVHIGAGGATRDLGELCDAVHLDGDPVAGARVVDECHRSHEETAVAG